MPSIQYGNKTIEYSILEKKGLKTHYISVQKGEGVVLKGKPVSLEQSQQLILKKAKWILEKLELVRSIGDDDIVTGSRVQYLGRRYYVQVLVQKGIEAVEVEFNESKFKVIVPSKHTGQQEIKTAFEEFFKQKAKEKIAPRVRKWSETTGLDYNDLKFLKMEKRWGSCTPLNNIVINTDAVKLPFTLIDYLIVHELVHTTVKNHSKEFWAEVAKYMPKWKELDDRMAGMKL